MTIQGNISTPLLVFNANKARTRKLETRSVPLAWKARSSPKQALQNANFAIKVHSKMRKGRHLALNAAPSFSPTQRAHPYARNAGAGKKRASPRAGALLVATTLVLQDHAHVNRDFTALPALTHNLRARRASSKTSPSREVASLAIRGPTRQSVPNVPALIAKKERSRTSKANPTALNARGGHLPN